MLQTHVLNYKKKYRPAKNAFYISNKFIFTTRCYKSLYKKNH